MSYETACDAAIATLRANGHVDLSGLASGHAISHSGASSARAFAEDVVWGLNEPMVKPPVRLNYKHEPGYKAAMANLIAGAQAGAIPRKGKR
jgi:hypothetical protein